MNLIILPFRVDAPAAALRCFSSADLLHIYLAQCASASSLQNMPSIDLGKLVSIRPVLAPCPTNRTEYIVSYSLIKSVYRDATTGEESTVYSYEAKIWGQVNISISYLSSPSLQLPAKDLVPLPSVMEQVTLYPAPRLHRVYQVSSQRSQNKLDWMMDYDTPTCLEPLSSRDFQTPLAILMSVLFAIRPAWAIDILFGQFMKGAAFTVRFRMPVPDSLKDVKKNLEQLAKTTHEEFSVEADNDHPHTFRVTLRPITRSQCINAVQIVAYTYTNGPWRYVWIRRGLDIRNHPHLGVQAKSVDVRFRGELLEQLRSTIKTNAGADYGVFVSNLPQYLLGPFEDIFKPGPSILQNYNRCICDLRAEMVTWDGETLAKPCNKQNGFCAPQYLECVRSRLLVYINDVVNRVLALFSPGAQMNVEDQHKYEEKEEILGLNPVTPVTEELVRAMERDSVPFLHCSFSEPSVNIDSK